MEKRVQVATRAELTEDDKSKMSKVIDYNDGSRVEIPINKDGSVRWYEDKLKKDRQ